MISQLIISETFYSIQGEGKTAGTLAVFLRLAGCNLRCNGFSYKDPQSGEHLGCDTKHVWRQGQKYTFEAICELWRSKGWLKALREGAHLVITGGEPLVQQAALLPFLRYLDDVLSMSPYIEMETNATLMPSPALFARLDQVNASPKLQHSGEPTEKAYIQDVLKVFAVSPKVYFKFVVARERDLQEIETQYIQKFSIPRSRVGLMPEGGTPTILAEKRVWVVEACKKRGFYYSPRLQVEIWGEVVGV